MLGIRRCARTWKGRRGDESAVAVAAIRQAEMTSGHEFAKEEGVSRGSNDLETDRSR